MNVIAKTATNSQFGWYRPHMLWTKHMPQKTTQDPPQSRYRGQRGSTDLTKSFHFFIPQHEGVFANSCVQSFVASEAWLMLSLSLCFDSLAARADSQSLTLFGRPRTAFGYTHKHAHSTHTPFTLFCVALSACHHFHCLVFTRRPSITSTLKEPQSGFIELKLGHRHSG